VKAIETIYDGYRFRSRMEARWAVFFKTAGIEYEYEPQGFELKNGRYLPDFWLPDLEAWFEVKGEFDVDQTPMYADLIEYTGKNFILALSAPALPIVETNLWWWSPQEIATGTRARNRPVWITSGYQNICEDVQHRDSFWMRFAGLIAPHHPEEALTLPIGPGPHYAPAVTPRILAAYGKARAARFEFGETPK
jgi:hypothetical protein